MKLSIIIITFNEEVNIKRTLESVHKIKSNNLELEIIVIDSGSNDNTENICKNYTQDFYFNSWSGYSNQKNFGLSKSTGEWILFLDADEELTENLAKEIGSLCLENIENTCYNIKRKTFYLGKLMNYSWYPDIKLRLVNKVNEPYWEGDYVHESIKFKSTELSNKTLQNYLIHYSYKNITHHFEKTLIYAILSSKDYFQKAKKFRYKNLIINPLFAFIKLYIIRKGFLDGWRGLLAGFSTFYYTFMKYILLKELESNKKK